MESGVYAQNRSCWCNDDVTTVIRFGRDRNRFRVADNPSRTSSFVSLKAPIRNTDDSSTIP